MFYSTGDHYYNVNDWYHQKYLEDLRRYQERSTPPNPDFSNEEEPMATKTTSTAEAVTTLKREPIKTEGLEALTDTAVLTEIQEVLGYGGVNDALIQKKVADVFKDLGIEPFNRETVDAYKKDMAKAASYVRRSNWETLTVKAKWVAKTLRQYEKHVPTFALLRAAEIQKALNAANIKGEFWVEELTVESRTERVPRNLDPFMVLRVGTEMYYTDVWDEPKFEGRRTK